MMGWISVKDKLPQDGDEILFYDEGGVVYVANYYNETNAFHEHNADHDGVSAINETVTHWMPFPEPPQNGANAKAISAVPKLIDALMEAQKAIETLPENALGIAELSQGIVWYNRDELLQQIKTALRNAGVTEDI